MRKTLLIPLGSGQWSERGAVGMGSSSEDGRLLEIMRLSSLATRHGWSLLRGAFDEVEIAGDPPEAEIGFGLAALAALATWPPKVSLYDQERLLRRRFGPWTFARKTLPFALTQMGASGAAIVIQRMAASAISRWTTSSGVNGPLRRVLYLRPAVGTGMSYGGSVTHSHGLIRALRSVGIEVAALTTDDAIATAAERDPDPPCHWTVLSPARLLQAIPASAAVADDLALLRAAKRVGAEVIYQRHARFSLSGALLSRWLGRPLFLEYNGSEAFVGTYWNRTPFVGQLRLCEEAVLNAAARIFVVSAVDRDDLIQRGIDPKRIILTPNAVDAERFSIGGGSVIRRELGFRADDIVVGFVGTFGPWHGAPVLARALRRVSGACPQLKGLFVGTGPELERTRAEITDADLQQSVRFVGGVDHGKVPRYLDACDILVSPQTPLPNGIEFFGSPTKIFEYMAAGKAIAASRLGQIGSILADEQTALLVEPGSVEDLAGALEVLARKPDLRKRLGAAARMCAVEQHSWRDNAQRIVEAYEEVSSEN